MNEPSGSPAPARKDTTWTADAYGKPYISATVTTYDLVQSYAGSKRVEQVQDAWGNLTSMKVFNGPAQAQRSN